MLDETGKTLDELDWVVCHQANSRIIDHCVRALKADPAKFYKNMDRHGNTSAASIPVALNELAENGQLQPGPAAGLHRLWRRPDMGRHDRGIRPSQALMRQLPPKGSFMGG